MELLNLGATLSVVMRKAGGDSSSVRAYMQFHLADESDMKVATLQNKNLMGSDSDDDIESLFLRSAIWLVFRTAEAVASSVSSTSSYVSAQLIMEALVKR